MNANKNKRAQEEKVSNDARRLPSPLTTTKQPTNKNKTHLTLFDELASPKLLNLAIQIRGTAHCLEKQQEEEKKLSFAVHLGTAKGLGLDLSF